MKKDIKLKAFTFVCTALLLLSGCKDESYPEIIFEEGEGGFSMTELNIEVNTNIPVISRGDDVDISEYQVKIINPTTGKPVSDKMVWKFRNMPEVITLPVGKYRVEVESFDWSNLYAEFDKPHYTGKYDFEVKAGQITKADKVPCNLNNVKVTVQYTDALKNILDEDAKTTVVASNTLGDDGFNIQLEFGRDETRAGYFRYVEGSSTLVSTLSYKYNNVENEIYHTMTGVAPGQHRIIVYDYVTSDPNGTVSRGDIKIDVKVYSVDIDGTISVKEGVLDDSDRPGHEDVSGTVEPENPTQPQDGVIDIVNPQRPYFDLDKINEVKEEETTGREYKLTINSSKGFSGLNVVIKSNDLTPELLEEIGLSNEFDLATGLTKDGLDISQALSGTFKFPVKQEVTGSDVKKVDFNITEFVPLLCIYPGDHSFVLTVTDKDGNVKEVELKFRAL